MIPLIEMINDIDAHEIVNNLWQGSLPPSGGALMIEGFNVLVLCAREHQPTDDEFTDINVIRVPFNDDAREINVYDKKLIHDVTLELSKLLRAGEKILVTCYAGLNRSGFITALTMHKAFGWSGSECAKIVRAERNWLALSNLKFSRILDSIPERTEASGTK